MGRVSGKVALVTGSASGIGRAAALALAQEGATIAALDRSSNIAITVARIQEIGGHAFAIQADLRTEAACAEAVATTVHEYGRLDILVNAAGIFPRYALNETDQAVLDLLFGVNFNGPLFLCKHTIPIMQQQGGGSIINVGSIHGLCGGRELIAYAASKGALLNLTRTLARSYARDHIRVNYLIPGWVLTEGELAIQAQEGHDEAWLRTQGERLPTGRIQLPEDAADAIVFLASDESSQVNASILNTDGGRSFFTIL
ncbi:MAG: SDR family oxidoreductase [Chloroflexi bacterium]|nr:SDR family oxidoreductase [Chloroflexota bacterium]